MNKIKKFVSIKTITDIEVKSDIGYVPIKNMMKTIEYDVYQVTFSDGSVIKCADNHIFMDINNKEIFAAELTPENQIIGESGPVNPVEVIKLDYKEQMYDIQMEYHNKYYTNNVLSHNTTVAAGYIVHQMVFNAEYTTAVLANKGATSREILSRIKMMYEELPWFLQMGVSEWNKGRIQLGNKSRVISAAASTSSVRGQSVNCIDINTMITVKNKKTGEIENITVEELERRLGNS